MVEVKGVGGGHVNVAVEHGLFWVKQVVFVFTRCGNTVDGSENPKANHRLDECIKPCK